MSDAENFITRWSRKKRAAAQDAEHDATPATPAETGAPASAAATDTSAPAARDAGSELFDVSTLPSLDSITADTDIRAFLAPGVPAELTRAALRRAWAADPNIRDFVGLAENAWDFNAPDAITGFGPLEMTDELRRQIARMVGRSLDDGSGEPHQQGEPEAAAEPAIDVGSPSDAAASTALSQDESVKSESARSNSSNVLQCEEDRTATQNIPARPDNDQAQSDNDQLIAKRSHGRALPKVIT
jgi:hypothetical protein